MFLSAGFVTVRPSADRPAATFRPGPLSHSAEVRGLLIAVGVLGALVALAISRVRPVERPAAGPR